MYRKTIFFFLVFVGLLVLVGCGSSEPAPPAATATSAFTIDVAAGEMMFQQSCSACHGIDAKGVPALGKDLTTSDFLRGLSDDEFLTFVKTGRPSGDALNTTGVDMPPKGGNPALTDGQIMNIIGYVRTLDGK